MSVIYHPSYLEEVMATININIPYPAWQGIYSVNTITEELRKNQMLKATPLGIPRRITVKVETEKTEGFDDSIKVQYWYTGGQYATAIFGGYESHYGTTWHLVRLELRWKDWQLDLLSPNDRLKIVIKREEIEAIESTIYARRHLEEYPSSDAETTLAEREQANEKIIESLSAPILALRQERLAFLEGVYAKRAAEQANK